MFPRILFLILISFAALAAAAETYIIRWRRMAHTRGRTTPRSSHSISSATYTPTEIAALRGLAWKQHVNANRQLAVAELPVAQEVARRLADGLRRHAGQVLLGEPEVVRKVVGSSSRSPLVNSRR